MLDDAISLVIDALGGRVAAPVLQARFAPRLLARGSFSDVPRFAAFREEPVVVGDVQARGDWAARAVVTTGSSRWELDVVVSPDPPHQIVSFQPRPVADDAVSWESVRKRLREADHRW